MTYQAHSISRSTAAPQTPAQRSETTDPRVSSEGVSGVHAIRSCSQYSLSGAVTVERLGHSKPRVKASAIRKRQQALKELEMMALAFERSLPVSRPQPASPVVTALDASTANSSPAPVAPAPLALASVSDEQKISTAFAWWAERKSRLSDVMRRVANSSRRSA